MKHSAIPKFKLNLESKSLLEFTLAENVPYPYLHGDHINSLDCFILVYKPYTTLHEQSSAVLLSRVHSPITTPKGDPLLYVKRCVRNELEMPFLSKISARIVWNGKSTTG